MVSTEFVKGLSLRDSTIPDQLIKTSGSIASPHAQQVSRSNLGPFPKSHPFSNFKNMQENNTLWTAAHSRSYAWL